jgi:uncharacterized protein with HEPN domain
MEIKDSTRVAHILEAARDIENFLEGKDRAALDSNKMLLFAVIRATFALGKIPAHMVTEFFNADRHPFTLGWLSKRMLE